MTNAQKGQRLTHPAFGLISTARQSNCQARLFGTTTPGYTTMSLQIDSAFVEFVPEMGRNLIQPDKRLLQVNLSPLQFAQMICSAGEGEGTPCTIVYRDGKLLPPIDHPTTTLEHIEEKFRQEMATLGAGCNELLQQARALRDKPNVNKSDREAIVKMSEDLVAKITATTPYVVSQFSEATEKLAAEWKQYRSLAPAPPNPAP